MGRLKRDDGLVSDDSIREMIARIDKTIAHYRNEIDILVLMKVSEERLLQLREDYRRGQQAEAVKAAVEPNSATAADVE